jgi:hypothetical protein
MIRKSNARRNDFIKRPIYGIAQDGTLSATSWTPTTVVNTWTVEVWAYPMATATAYTESTTDTQGTSGGRYIIGAHHQGTDRGSGLSIGTNGVYMVQHGTGCLSCLAAYTSAITGWNHIAMRSSSKVASVVINGTTVRTGLTSPVTNYYSPDYHLFQLSTYGTYNGYADEIRVWNYARTDAEIKKDMYNRISSKSPGLISLIRLYDVDAYLTDLVINQCIIMNNSTLTRIAVSPCIYLPNREE